MLEVKLPEIGENIESGTVLSISVSVGDSVTKDQDLLELETEKATLPVPAPADGIIKEINVAVGDEVAIGSVIMKIEARQDSKNLGEVSPDSQGESGGKAASKPAPKKQTREKQRPQAPVEAPQVQASAPTQSQINPKDIKLAVIGGGPGGYVAAFHAADLGMDVTLVDTEANPGGVCVYRGCIPSKALLHVAKVLSEAKHVKELGITFSEPDIDLKKVREWKDSVVTKLTSGTGILRDKRKIKFIQGRATFVDSNTLSIEKTSGGLEELGFDKAILATGSHPIVLPFAPESKNILDSTSGLELESIPKTMLVIGGGYIGLELGTVYAQLGSEVSVVEMTDYILPGCDRDLATVLFKRISEKVSKNIMLNTQVTGIKDEGNSVSVSFKDLASSKTKTEKYEKILVAIGRRPNSKNLGLENTAANINDKGFVEINAQRQTSDPNIYAIGDIAGEPMLAHKASHEGRVAVEAIAGEKVAFEPNAIPAVVFTDPEIAWCGVTETQAKKEGRDVKVVKFPWAASGRALTLDRTDGLTKLLIDPSSERILGVGIAGPGAGELISEGVLAVEMGAVAADLKLSIHPHPTLTETVMEAAESFFGTSTHIYKPKK